MRFLYEHADVLLLAGDLTQHGTVAEAEIVAAEFSGAGVPVIAVLGNHDYHSDQQAGIASTLRQSGIRVLEGSGTALDLPATWPSTATPTPARSAG